MTPGLHQQLYFIPLLPVSKLHLFLCLSLIFSKLPLLRLLTFWQILTTQCDWSIIPSHFISLNSLPSQSHVNYLVFTHFTLRTSTDWSSLLCPQCHQPLSLIYCYAYLVLQRSCNKPAVPSAFSFPSYPSSD